jgi:catechol 2,3-dioxygenase-like lactoylglutathione lyase family enzyme
MLGNATVYATIAVKDMEAAKTFYGQKLGLSQVDENPGGVMYRSGDSKLFVYQSEFAGTNQATCASWDVTDLEAVVSDLKQKGITFEQYDMPGATREGDIYVMGGEKAAWFKDPDGNIIAVSSSDH